MTTKLEILEMGLRLWRVDPAYVTTRRIENELNMAHGTVQYHFGGIVSLKNAIAEYAIEKQDAKIVSQLIIINHPKTMNISDLEKKKYLNLATQ